MRKPLTPSGPRASYGTDHRIGVSPRFGVPERQLDSAGDAMLRLDPSGKTVPDRRPGAQGRRRWRCRRPGHGADRPVRRRQVDPDPLRQPAGRADLGGKVFLKRRRAHRPARRAQLRAARRRMGMIFQEYALVERLTVMENVLSGRLGYVGFWRSWFRKFPASRHRRGVPPARARRPRPHGRQARRRAVRRPAPARRHLPRADPGPGAAAGRRTDSLA